MCSVAKCPCLLCVHQAFDIYYAAREPCRGRMLFLHPRAISHPGTLRQGFLPYPGRVWLPTSLPYRDLTLKTTQKEGCDHAPGMLSSFPITTGIRAAVSNPGALPISPLHASFPPSPCSKAREEMRKPKGCRSAARCRSCHSSHSELQGIRAPRCRVSSRSGSHSEGHAMIGLESPPENPVSRLVKGSGMNRPDLSYRSYSDRQGEGHAITG